MNDKVVIRKGNKEDASKMVEYLKEIGGESDFLTFGKNELNVNVSDEENFIDNSNKNENSLFLVAEVNGKIVGNLNFSAGKNSKVRHVGEFGVSVLKAYWGNKIGNELIEYLIKWSKHTGIIKKINLMVREDNVRAIKLYKKIGFVEEGILKREFLSEGKFYSGISMGFYVN
ncbi:MULTISPECIES: GNAT family N-acetyltransferase [Clostridium]|uniref:GNAT family N-acetyltransferase n=1 Tax=Clostridium TaxID=1485 RepID=UPI000825D9E1|nr:MULTISPECIES: GNAT family N-acetyltransferase [Clostridium]PJI06912.1 N-acetyltransferase [Clostridium sp. CT7]